ncbi:MAG: ABC transporter permease, partial [Alkalibacterium sp.]
IVSMTLLGMIASLFLSVRIGFFLAAVIFLLFLPFVLKISQSDSWNWELLIESEQRRVQKIYSLINLFIETPYSKHKVKRLRILDVLYQIPALKQNTEIYYLSRMFVRNSNFSGLFLRLVLIGSIVIYFSENGLINSLISVLFLYLIGFQLIPLRETFKKTIYFRLYPDTDADKIKPTQKLIMLLLAVSTIVYGLASISSGSLTVARLVLLNSLFSMFFVYVYLPRRLRK